MEEKDNETIGLKSIIVRYLLHWKLFLGAFLFSCIVGVLYLIFYPRTYEIKAVVELQAPESMSGAGLGLGEAAGLMKSFGLGGVPASTINMEDEIVELSSNSLISQVVTALGLSFSYNKPYSFYNEYEKTPIVLSVEPGCIFPMDDIVHFDIKSSNGNIKVRVESTKIKSQDFSFTTLPAKIVLSACSFILDYKKDKISSFKIKAKYTPASWVAESLINDLFIEELSKSSNVVEMSCKDYEKNRAVNIINKLIELYNKQGVEYDKEEAYKSIAFLSGRIDSVTMALSETEVEIAKYKKINKLTAVETDVMFYSEQMKELQMKLIELEAQLNLVSMIDSFIQNPKNKYNLVPVLLSMGNEKDGIISTYNEILLERARVIQNSSIDNPLVGTLSEQADNLRGSVYGTIRNTQEGLRLSLDDLKNKETLLLGKMSDFPAQEYAYRQLIRQQEIYQGIYLILLQKREELLMSIGHAKPKARALDQAFVLAKPVAPRKLFVAIGIFLFTLIIPVVYLFCREQIHSLYSLYKEMK
ncbi:MAG: tyrosine protein kinase [Massilibacteroides sp.]|nr:tyrosine protein kinase [Massilibacteroides sp.]